MPYITPSTAEQKIEAGYLTWCSPQAAYDWLQARAPKTDVQIREAHGLFSSPTPNLAEYVMIRRQDPFIDLGLARFAYTRRAVLAAYQRGGAACRIAAWSNVAARGTGFGFDIWADKKDLERVSAYGHIDELITMAANPVLGEGTISELVGRTAAFANLTDMRWAACLVGLSKNPRLKEEYGPDRPMDGLAEYSHNRVFADVWKLASTLPVLQHWASLLSQVLQNCLLPYGMEKEAHVLLERWRIDRERQTDEKYYYPGPSFPLRTRLADLLKPDNELLGSEDAAVRLSFWKRFDPMKHPGWSDSMVAAVQASVNEFDAHEVLTAALSNKRLWQSEGMREALSALCRGSPDRRHDMMMSNVYDGFERRHRKEHPEWFRDVETPVLAPISRWAADDAEPAWVAAMVERIDGLPARIPVQTLHAQAVEAVFHVQQPWWSSVPWWAWIAVSLLAFMAARSLTMHY